MSDTKTPGDKTLHVSPKTLTLKRPVEQNTVRQSFSHGRSKAVVVETVKRRAPGTSPKEASAAPAKATPAAPAAAPAPRAPQPAARTAAPAAPAATPAAQQRGSGVVLRTLSEQERDARLSALTDAKRREEEDRQRQSEEAKRRAEREARDAREREAAETRKHDEEER